VGRSQFGQAQQGQAGPDQGAGAVQAPGAKRGTTVEVNTDEFIRPDSSLEGLGRLKPAFRTDGKGSVTAGNSSGINDGACALLVASEDAVARFGLTPRARIVAAEGHDLVGQLV